MNINNATKKITFESLREVCNPSMLMWLQDDNEICIEHDECECLSSMHDHKRRVSVPDNLGKRTKIQVTKV